jgi:hypothetical protein
VVIKNQPTSLWIRRFHGQPPESILKLARRDCGTEKSSGDYFISIRGFSPRLAQTQNRLPT